MYSIQDVIDGLQYADKQTEQCITSKNYDEFRRDEDPSSTTIQRKDKSWSELRKDAGVNNKGRYKYTKQDCIDALQSADEQEPNYLTQVTYRKIKSDYDPSVKTIQNHLGSWRDGKIAAGLKHRDYRGSMPVNKDYFEKPDNEAAYWLGLIFADGYIEESTSDGRSKFTLSLQEEDKHHIELFKNTIDSSHKIGHVKNDDPFTDMYRLSISRSKFCENLLDHNLRGEKTHSSSLPDFRGEKFRHFIRGLHDGDGTYSRNSDLRICLTGSVNRLERINNWLPFDAKLYDDSQRDSCGQL